MKKKSHLLFLISLGTFLLIGCGGGDSGNPDEIPRFVTRDFTQLEKIDKISKFRSGEGHDYSDFIETCRTMKHYYDPKSENKANNVIEIYSPVDGEIEELVHAGLGTSGELIGKRIHIKSSEYPSYSFVLFHIDLVSSSIVLGKKSYGRGTFGVCPHVLS